MPTEPFSLVHRTQVDPADLFDVIDVTSPYHSTLAKTIYPFVATAAFERSLWVFGRYLGHLMGSLGFVVSVLDSIKMVEWLEFSCLVEQEVALDTIWQPLLHLIRGELPRRHAN
jgi:hypothetical protein